jgi:V/A-type H+-transporting ATPase subunit D
MIGPGQAPTRAAVLEMMNEQVVVREAYVFLDEKRLLLASELLRQLRHYRELQQEVGKLQRDARHAMEAAVRCHGLNGLQVYPAASVDGVAFTRHTRNFMGVTLVDTKLEAEDSMGGHPPAVYPSGAAEQCRQLFCDMLRRNAVLAGVTGNLYRLLAEYRVTERRSRALENVILPEIEQSLRDMTAHLEELDLEDAIRVRLQSNAPV